MVVQDTPVWILAKHSEIFMVYTSRIHTSGITSQEANILFHACFNQLTNQLTNQSVVSICHSTEGQSILQLEALKTLCSLFQSMQCFIDNELMPHEKDYTRWSHQEWPAMMGFYSVARDLAFRVLCLLIPLLKSKQNMEWTVQAVRLSLSLLSTHAIQDLPHEDMYVPKHFTHTPRHQDTTMTHSSSCLLHWLLNWDLET
jgi:hypothetical protein